ARDFGELRIVVQQRVLQRAGRIAGAGMHDEARRLVDDDDVGVLVADVERDLLGRGADLALEAHLDEDRLAAAHDVARQDLGAVERRGAGLDPGREPRARIIREEIGQNLVEAAAGRRVGHGCVQRRFGSAHGLWGSGSRVSGVLCVRVIMAGLMIAEPDARMRVSHWSRTIARIALVTLLAFLAGCSLFHRGKKGDPLDTLPVEELYQHGVEALEAGNNDLAARSFERLVARFPFGPYTEQSQINLAYAQYKDGKPDDAYSTINRFIKTYPTHRHIDYAYYLRGLINFNRSAGMIERYVGQDMTKRDQANLRQSFDDFGALVTRYPESRYSPDARQRMVYLRNMMAQADLHIAVFYLRRNAYV